MKQGKVWGETEQVFNDGTISVNFLEIKKGGFCSEHQHSQKMNMFYVISGHLQVSQWPGASEGEQPDITGLKAGQSTTVPVGSWHMFRAIEDTICLEIYEIRFSGPDITRRSHGGVST